MSAELPEPVAWTLTSELQQRETTCKAHLWFVNPQNSAWEPLYTAAQLQEAARQAMERGISVIQALRDSHCADTQGGEAVCMPDTITCDFVVAWNDAIEELRALIPQDPDHLAGVGNMVEAPASVNGDGEKQ